MLNGLEASVAVLEVNVLISRTVYVVVLAQRMQDRRQLDPVRLPSSVAGGLRQLVTSALIEVSLSHVHLAANAVVHLARLRLMLHLLDYRWPCVSLLPLIESGRLAHLEDASDFSIVVRRFLLHGKDLV